jgi:hypothetical protein
MSVLAPRSMAQIAECLCATRTGRAAVRARVCRSGNRTDLQNPPTPPGVFRRFQEIRTETSAHTEDMIGKLKYSFINKFGSKLEKTK